MFKIKMNRDNIIARYALDLVEAESFDQCFAVLTRTIQELGFDGVLYTCILLHFSKDSLAQPVFKTSEAYSREFLIHYDQANFIEKDFVIREIVSGREESIDWWGDARVGNLNDSELEVIEVARGDYNIRNGFTVPALSNKHEVAGASIISGDNDEIYSRLLKKELRDIECLIKLFHARVHSDNGCRGVFVQTLLEQLNEREKDLLRFLSTGLPMKVIESKYDITPGYAKNLIKQVSKKLGVKNASQLRYLLGLYRIVDLL